MLISRLTTHSRRRQKKIKKLLLGVILEIIIRMINRKMKRRLIFSEGIRMMRALIFLD